MVYYGVWHIRPILSLVVAACFIEIKGMEPLGCGRLFNFLFFKFLADASCESAATQQMQIRS